MSKRSSHRPGEDAVNKEPEWALFRVGTPSARRNWVDSDCCPFTFVYHIAHVKEATRILEDGRIRSGLIYDQSRLNTKRACVSWVSPNTWAASIYGNVQFAFKWQPLVKRKNLYWVEHLKTPRQQIVRILITEHPYKDEPLKPYDPRKGDGPLYQCAEADQWYYNRNYTNEYMILADLSLDQCCGISFCDHHADMCKKKLEQCMDKGLKQSDAGITILGKLLAGGRREWASLFEDDSNTGHFELSTQSALEALCGKLTEAHKPRSASGPSPALAKSLIASMCMAAADGKKRRLRNLAGLFPSVESIETAYWEVTRSFFKGLKVGCAE